MPTKRISSLLVHPDNAATLLVSSGRPFSIIASHYQTIYVILVLHLIAILISENIFLWYVAAASIIFVTVDVFVALFLFQSPNPLLQHSLLVSLITGTLFFYNIPSKGILKRRCVQNCLAKVVTRSPRFFHSVSLLKYLHWSPVQSRIISKLCTIAYKTLSSGQPSYLMSMLYLAHPGPENSVRLFFTYYDFLGLKLTMKLVLFQLLSLLIGIHSLDMLSSSNSVVSFRHQMKTHLFRLVYPS